MTHALGVNKKEVKKNNNDYGSSFCKIRNKTPKMVHSSFVIKPFQV